jgi:RNA polymerase sigma factor (sigma-70 family)
MDLLRRARARAEFERFAASHVDGLLRAAYLMVGDRGEAEDIVQECMLRLARKWPHVRGMEHPGAYARRVMFSLVLDGGPQRSRRSVELVAIEPATARDTRGATAASLDSRADLLRALAGLPGRQRYFADLPEAEVATVLGCSVGTVKSSASRALERLREALDTAAAPPTDEPRSETPRRIIR